MRKNREIKLSVTALCVLILAIVMLGLGLGLIRGMFQPSFNPVTDDCDKWNPCDVGDDLSEDGWCWASTTTEYRYTNGEHSNNCAEWHPKNKCQLDPNTEGCICDEYKTITHRCFVNATYTIFTEYGNFTLVSKSPNNERQCIDYWGDSFLIDYPYIILEQNWRNHTYIPDSNDCIKSHEAPKPIKIDLTKEKCVEWTDGDGNIYTPNDCDNIDKESNMCYLYDKKIKLKNGNSLGGTGWCSKKEPLTECEKNNNEYTQDKKLAVYCDATFRGYIEDNKINVGKAKECIQIEETICRLKTIQDLSCSELLDYYENGNECLKYKEPIGTCIQWKYPIIERPGKRNYVSEDKKLILEYLKRC